MYAIRSYYDIRWCPLKPGQLCDSEPLNLIMIGEREFTSGVGREKTEQPDGFFMVFINRLANEATDFCLYAELLEELPLQTLFRLFTLFEFSTGKFPETGKMKADFTSCGEYKPVFNYYGCSDCDHRSTADPVRVLLAAVGGDRAPWRAVHPVDPRSVGARP